ncbi:hypothetical protein [Paraburkholderia sp. J63]|uniref:hypothetical protein n=1 Tax=Paraburkholderia sp. J63 TaxID=2805434 RepID=UPI002ABD3B1D|nr:hypothetical protein [Paraburkholderia sp. J63]
MKSKKGSKARAIVARIVRQAGERCADATAALFIATARGCRIAYFKGFAPLFYTRIKPPKSLVTTITAAPQE